MTAEADLGEGAVTMDALVIGWSFRSDNTEYTHIQFDNTDDKIGTTGTPPADVSALAPAFFVPKRRARGERREAREHSAAHIWFC